MNHMKRYVLLIAFVAVASCASPGSRINFYEAVYLNCRAYTVTLDTLAGLREQDRLSASQIATVDNLRPSMNAICQAEKPPVNADTAYLVETGMRALLAIEFDVTTSGE